MAPRILPALFHAFSISLMLWGWLNLPMRPFVAGRTGGRLEFLTIQGLWIAQITMALSLLADLLPGRASLVSLKRRFFMIALPLAVVISSVYWSLITLRPHMILQPETPITEPTSLNSSKPVVLFHIPFPVDLAVHAFPGTALLVDFILFERKYTSAEAKYGAPLSSIIFGLWYTSFVEWTATFNKDFPYPFLNTTFPKRVVIYCGVVSIALVSFKLINTLHRGRPILAGVQKTS